MFALAYQNNFPWARKVCWSSSDAITKLCLDNIIFTSAQDQLLGNRWNTVNKAQAGQSPTI